MRSTVSWLLAVAGLAMVAVAPGQSQAADLTALVSFNNADGAFPLNGLIADANALKRCHAAKSLGHRYRHGRSRTQASTQVGIAV